MPKGGPSLNPLGRGASIQKRAAAGTDGIAASGGYYEDAGIARELVGREKWVAYARAYQRPAVAIAVLLRSALLAGTKWSVEPNDSGSKDAERGVEIVERGLLYAKLRKPWPVIVRQAGMSWFNGFSLHATSLGRRADGSVAFGEIERRPAHTIERWYRRTDQDPWEAVEQQTDAGRTHRIPLDTCLHVVNDQLSDAPTGTGVLALVVERIRRAQRYEGLEGHELFSSMGGLPIARVPLEELSKQAEAYAETTEERIAWVKTRTQAIVNAVQRRVKTPEIQQFLTLDSAVHQDVDGNPTGDYKWAIEIVKGDLSGITEIRKVITDLELDVARILGVEFAFIGGDAGSFALHSDKTSMFVAALQTTLSEIATAAEQQLVRRLIAANGLDPETAAPFLIPAPIGAEDVEKAARTLGLINMAQLPPNHPAKVVMYERLNLPWVEESEDELLLPRARAERPADETDEIDDVEEDETQDVEEES